MLKTHIEIRNDVRVGPATNSLDEAPRHGKAPSMEFVHSAASVTVTYRQDARLGLLVPSEMLETYEGPRPNRMDNTTGTTKINCRATYSGFHRVEPGSR